VPVEEPLESTLVRDVDAEQLIAFLKAMEFTTLTRRVAAKTDTAANDVESAKVSTPGFEGARVEEKVKAQGTMTPAALAEERAREAASTTIDRGAYETVFDAERLEKLFDEARWSGCLPSTPRRPRSIRCARNLSAFPSRLSQAAPTMCR
jgi:DNA polymerase-1